MSNEYGVDFSSEDFLYISEHTTINQNTTWDNKVYIEDGKIVTVDGVTLDITSMDVILVNVLELLSLTVQP